MENMMPQRIVKNVLLLNLDLSDMFNGRTIPEVIEYLEQLNKNYPKKDIVFYIENHSYNEPSDLVLYEQQLETDAEYNRRLQKVKNAKLKIQEKEYKEYQRLHRKFGNV